MNTPSAARMLSPERAAEMQSSGALLVDVRETDELALGVIPGARHAPLSALRGGIVPADPARPVIFHCRSGRRTTNNVEALREAAAGSEVYLLDGGLDAWRAAGLPVDEHQPS